MVPAMFEAQILILLQIKPAGSKSALTLKILPKLAFPSIPAEVNANSIPHFEDIPNYLDNI